MFQRVADGTAADNASFTWTGLTTGTTGDSAGARILAYANLGTAVDGAAVKGSDAAITTPIVIPAVTTTKPNSMAIGVAIRINDTAHTFTVATWTERTDDNTTSGTGHGTVTADRVMAVAGSTGTANVTPSNTTSSRVLAASVGFEAVPNLVSLTPIDGVDAEQGLSVVKEITLSSIPEIGTQQALDISSFQPVTVVSLTPIVESSTPQAMSVTKVNTVLPLVETGTAQSVVVRKISTLSPLSEAGALPPLSAVQISILSPITETASVVGLSTVRRVALSPVFETGALVSIGLAGGSQNINLTPISSTEMMMSIDVVKRSGLTSVVESSTAQPMDVVKFAPIQPVGEAGTLVPLAVGAGAAGAEVTGAPRRPTMVSLGTLRRSRIRIGDVR